MKTIYDNNNLWDDYAEEAKEILLDQHVTDASNDDVWETIYNLDSIAREEALDMLQDAFYSSTCLVRGELHLWDGVKRVSRMFSDFNKAYSAVIRDCDYVRILDDRGHLRFECSHHDGTNFFEFFKVTKSGVTYVQNWRNGLRNHEHETSAQVLERLLQRYTRLPRVMTH